MSNHFEEQKTNRLGLSIAFSITLLMTIVEIIGGFMSNSLALLGDAGHMFTDTLALGLSLFALHIAQRPATTKRTFGYHRMEILSALTNGIFLIVIAFGIFYEAYQRFLNPPQVRSGLMLIIATTGLGANLTGIYILNKANKENLNVRGAFLHMVGDTLSSVGVITGGIIIFITGWNIVDPLIGVLIGGVILRGAVSLIIESGQILLEATPKQISLPEVATTVKKVEGVKDLHDLHIWTITSGLYALSAHVLIDDQKISQANQILHQVEDILSQQYNITHTTLQLECEHCQEELVCQIVKNNFHQD